MAVVWWWRVDGAMRGGELGVVEITRPNDHRIYDVDWHLKLIYLFSLIQTFI